MSPTLGGKAEAQRGTNQTSAGGVFSFDIETVPDVETGQRVYGLRDLSEKEIAEVMFQQQRQSSGTEFLRHHLHRIVAISVVLRSSDRLRVWSLGTPESSERELIERFFDGVTRYTPVLVSWNGSGFDLPVLHYRSMLHGVQAPRYWEMGEQDTQFRWNNYVNRFHFRHTDLMDVLAGYQLRAAAPLADMATLLGFPGKLGMDGTQVWERYLAGDLSGIRDYCETDALNTYLIYLRFELVRGRLDAAAYEAECQLLRNTLIREEKPHLNAFLEAWAQ